MTEESPAMADFLDFDAGMGGGRSEGATGFLAFDRGMVAGRIEVKEGANRKRERPAAQGANAGSDGFSARGGFRDPFALTSAASWPSREFSSPNAWTPSTRRCSTT